LALLFVGILRLYLFVEGHK